MLDRNIKMQILLPKCKLSSKMYTCLLVDHRFFIL